MAEVTGLSGDALAALSRGEAFMVYGRRLPKDAGCVLGVATGFVPFAWVLDHFGPCLTQRITLNSPLGGEDRPTEGLRSIYTAATYYNDSAVSCVVPQALSGPRWPEKAPYKLSGELPGTCLTPIFEGKQTYCA